MDIVQARTDIINWITGFVEKPHPALNGWAPCPFARRARLEERFDIQEGQVNPVIDMQNASMNNNDVVAWVYSPLQFTADQFNSMTDTLNTQYLQKRGLYALCDHPDDVETVNGVVMNQGDWAIVFLQDLDKLNQHAEMLAEKGYYQDWPEQYLKQLFHGRKDPRHDMAIR